MFHRGIVVVLTGKSPSYSRAHVTQRIRAAGGIVANAVSGGVGLLVAPNNFSTTAKYNEALRRQIPIVLYDDFLDAMQLFTQSEQVANAAPAQNDFYVPLVNFEAANALIATSLHAQITASRYRNTF